MKILYISPLRIGDKNGGGIEAKKIHLSLKNIISNEENFEYRVISLNKNIEFKLDVGLSKNRYKDFLARLFLHSNYLYLEWFKIKKKVFKFDADVTILGNSRLGFIAKEIREHDNSCFIIGHFDNIELDYLKPYLLKYKGLTSKIFNIIEKTAVKRDEKLMLENMDLGLFLTNRDVRRAQEIYDLKSDYRVLPICVKEFKKLLKPENNYDINLVFIGSLWYGSNIEAVKWFLTNIWQKLLEKKYNINLIIGGSHPSDDFLTFLHSFDGISLYPDFKNIEEIIPKNSILISPIQTGTGMKVKVAEALSLGLPIVGSPETLIGYKEAINDKDNNNIINKAVEPQDYITHIINIINTQSDNKIKNNAKLLYERYYSLKRSIKTFNNIFDKMR